MFQNFLQNDGINNTIIAKSSSLPNIIPKLKTHFEGSDSDEKFPFGPIISPRPGPTFEIEVAAPEIEVTKSKPVNDNIEVRIKNITMYKKINEITDDINLSSILFFPYFIMNIPLG